MLVARWFVTSVTSVTSVTVWAVVAVWAVVTVWAVVRGAARGGAPPRHRFPVRDVAPLGGDVLMSCHQAPTRLGAAMAPLPRDPPSAAAESGFGLAGGAGGGAGGEAGAPVGERGERR